MFFNRFIYYCNKYKPVKEHLLSFSLEFDVVLRKFSHSSRLKPKSAPCVGGSESSAKFGYFSFSEFLGQKAIIYFRYRTFENDGI